MKRISLLNSAFVLLGIALTLSSCKEDEPEPIKEETSISIISGSGQTAQIETALPNPIEVIVKDQNGDAFAGAAVTFSVAEGSVSAATSITDAEGKAITNWTVGSTVGTQTLSVTAFKKDGVTALVGSPLTVTATTNPIPRIATTIELTDLGEQDAVIGTTLLLPIEVLVKDQFSVALSGVVVNFSVAEGSVSASTVTTNAQGKASVSWTLGMTLGKQTLTITAFKADGTTPLVGSPINKFAFGAEPKTVTDTDGNVYPYVVIGTQVWMAENLRTTKLNDGSAIPLVLDKITWSNLTSPGYTWYDNDETTNKLKYGALYNWYTVNTTKLCPSGWHVPTKDEWQILSDYLGGHITGGAALVETGTDYWLGPNTIATNSTGFSARPAGHRDSGGNYAQLTLTGKWWSSTQNDIEGAWFRWVEANYAGFPVSYTYKDIGHSIRCIKD